LRPICFDVGDEPAQAGTVCNERFLHRLELDQQVLRVPCVLALVREFRNMCALLIDQGLALGGVTLGLDQ